jgi:hypothetical protein
MYYWLFSPNIMSAVVASISVGVMGCVGINIASILIASCDCHLH